MRYARCGLALGAAGQLVLVAALQLVVGLGVAGLAAGLAFNAAVVVLLGRALRSAGPGPGEGLGSGVGAANLVTLGRSVLVGGVVALVAAGADHPVAITALATPALLLDLVDGRVARWRDAVTGLGARFDMEVDAALILALSVAAASRFGSWVLAIGLARYAFGAIVLVVPWLRAPMPPSRWRKVVAALQGVTLTVAVAGVLPAAAAGTALVVALALLTHSFAGQVGWLWRHRRGRAGVPVPRRGGALLTGVSFAVLWFALLVPARLDRLGPVAFARIPIEAAVVAGLVLVLPGRVGRVVAVGAGITLSTSVLLRVLDLGFHAVLDRPFNPITDTGTFGPAEGVLGDSIGHGWAVVVGVGAAAVAVAVFVLIPWCVLRLTRLAAQHRPTTLRTVGVLTLAWTLCAGLGLRIDQGEPLASSDAARPVYDHARAAGSAIADARAFSADLHSRHDPEADVPAGAALSALRGKDVLLVFVESYGQVAVQGSSFAGADDSALRSDTAQLASAGYGSRSAFLTSSTFGGISWLAHSTIQSGLWIDSQSRYDELVASRRYTLSDAFRRAGWRTVSDVPSDTHDWPQGKSFYHYDALYDSRNTGYRGPRLGYARIPDQYSLAALRDRELARPHRKPVFAEIDLDSSHTPWAPLPSLVAWPRLGDGAMYRTQLAGQPGPSEVWRSTRQVRANYARSIRYSMASLVSYATTFHDPNLVMVVLGDHQPWNKVSGGNPTHNVPISIVSADPAVLSAIHAWHWQPGLLPGPSAPLWRMDSFRDRFLDAYSTAPPGIVSRVPH